MILLSQSTQITSCEPQPTWMDINAPLTSSVHNHQLAVKKDKTWHRFLCYMFFGHIVCTLFCEEKMYWNVYYFSIFHIFLTSKQRGFSLISCWKINTLLKINSIISFFFTWFLHNLTSSLRNADSVLIFW